MALFGSHWNEDDRITQERDLRAKYPFLKRIGKMVGERFPTKFINILRWRNIKKHMKKQSALLILKC